MASVGSFAHIPQERSSVPRQCRNYSEGSSVPAVSCWFPEEFDSSADSRGSHSRGLHYSNWRTGKRDVPCSSWTARGICSTMVAWLISKAVLLVQKTMDSIKQDSRMALRWLRMAKWWLHSLMDRMSVRLR